MSRLSVSVLLIPVIQQITDNLAENFKKSGLDLIGVEPFDGATYLSMKLQKLKVSIHCSTSAKKVIQDHTKP